MIFGEYNPLINHQKVGPKLPILCLGQVAILTVDRKRMSRTLMAKLGKLPSLSTIPIFYQSIDWVRLMIESNATQENTWETIEYSPAN